MFSLETTGAEMLMRRETEGLTCYRLFMDVTQTKRGKRSDPFLYLAGNIAQYNNHWWNECTVLQSKTLTCALAVETKVENYFPSEVSKVLFALMA